MVNLVFAINPWLTMDLCRSPERAEHAMFSAARETRVATNCEIALARRRKKRALTHAHFHFSLPLIGLAHTFPLISMIL